MKWSGRITTAREICPLTGILIFGLLYRIHVRDSNPLIVFGRVPLFYYLLHIPLIHFVAILLA
jgi:hypothetical protein